MRTKRILTVISAFALLVLVTGAVVTQRGTLAQDSESHPAHIHSGTCTELGDVVFPLSNVSDEIMMDGTPMAGEAMGPSDNAVEWSVTTVAAPLADIVSGGHAINIHESAENIGNYIACGNIGGVMMGASDLAIGLGELNGSGYSGVATLHDNGDGTTTVTVYLTEGTASAGAAETTTDTAAVSTGAAAVDIKGFQFNPATTEVKVGDTVTWTNNDSTPHTATQKPSGSGFQSGTLQPGDSFSYTFETAGTYDYYCEFHSGMTGQIIVS
ncbi:MAG: cupredoxin family copper-binding protein [Thermomicrobiales bacterium]